jgi:hypothetical protein
VVQDSIAKVHMDSIMADSAALAIAAQKAIADSVSADSALNALSTPADSIRALVSERNQQAAGITPSVSPALTPAASLKPEAATATAVNVCVVDLPAPLGPRNPTTSPSPTEKSRSETAWRAAPGYVKLRSRTAMVGGTAGGMALPSS